MILRSLILTFFSVFLTHAVFAQADNTYPTGLSKSEIPDPMPLPDFPYVDGDIMYQRVYEFDSDQATLYGIALKYVSDYYRSAKAAIDVTDPATGLIIVKGSFKYASDFYYQFFGTNKDVLYYTTGHTLKLEVKEKKIRISINNLATVELSGTSSGSGVPFEITVYELIEEYRMYAQQKKLKKSEKMEFLNKSELLSDMDSYARSFLLGLSPYFEKQLGDDW
jgi:hypothetical protein